MASYYNKFVFAFEHAQSEEDYFVARVYDSANSYPYRPKTVTVFGVVYDHTALLPHRPDDLITYTLNDEFNYQQARAERFMNMWKAHQKRSRLRMSAGNHAPYRIIGSYNLTTREEWLSHRADRQQWIADYKAAKKLPEHQRIEALGALAIKVSLLAHKLLTTEQANVVRDNHYKLDNYEWKLPPWSHQHWSRAPTTPTPWFHFLHVSTEDSTQVAYYPSVRHMMENRQVRTRPGKYLNHYHADIGTTEIRRWAEKMAPVELRLVPNTDPDKWEWVYENSGENFTSCMVYDRPSRHLHEDACGENHPVRAYATAHPKNSLALAWIGTDTNVFARTVVNTTMKTYVRIYGDDRIRHALESAGYTHNSRRTMDGQVMKCMHYDDSEYFLPYLDSCGGYQWFDELRSLVIVDADGGAESESSGVVDMDKRNDDDDESHICECCGDRDVDPEYDTYVEHVGTVCSRCIDRYYVYAHISRCCQEYIHNDDAVYNESNSEWYSDSYAGEVLAQTEDGTWYAIDATCTALNQNGVEICVHIDAATYLDHEFNGCEYALNGNTEEFDGEVYFHADPALQDAKDAALDAEEEEQLALAA